LANPSLWEHMAGGLLGNAPLLLLLFILTLLGPSVIDANLNLVNSIILASMFAGGSLAGFLVEARSRSLDKGGTATIGLVTGLLCYIFNFFFSQVLIPKIFPEYIVLVVFMAGAVLGGFLRRITSRRSPRKKK
jgi:hypothetical protein